MRQKAEARHRQWRMIEDKTVIDPNEVTWDDEDFDPGNRRLSFKDLNGTFVDSEKAGKLFVVKGLVTNDYPDRRSFISIRSNILDSKGTEVKNKIVFAGNPISDKKIQSLTPEEIDNRLRDKLGKDKMNINIQPNSSIPFMIVFSDLPEDMSEFTVEAISSSIADRFEYYNMLALADLRNSITAQEAYWIDNQTYAYSIDKIIGSIYGLYLNEGVTVSVVAADENEYTMKALHSKGDKTYIISGPGGTIQEQSPINRTFTNSIGMKFAYIPPGTFTMGSPSDEPGRDNVLSLERKHRVTLSKGFYMQTTEVTQAQWREIMGNNPSRFKGDDHPVEKVSWNDVKDFIRRLNQKEGTNKYHLPTEAQWEYACRAGTTTPFYTGNCISTDQANYDGNYPMPGCPEGEYREKTVRVGIFPPNSWGLYDMHGNVWEWCQDWYGIFPTGHVTDPKGPSSGTFRVLRGGSWINHARNCRSALRYPYSLGIRDNYAGFRVAKDF